MDDLETNPSEAVPLQRLDGRACGTENVEPKRWRVEFRSLTGIWALQCECDSSEVGARKTAEMICTERRRDTRVVEVVERRRIVCHYPLSSPIDGDERQSRAEKAP